MNKIKFKLLFLKLKILKHFGLTGVKCTVYNRYGKCLGKKDIARIKPGDYVREIGALCKVTGEYYEDEIDYVIPTENLHYSPLCLM